MNKEDLTIAAEIRAIGWISAQNELGLGKDDTPMGQSVSLITYALGMQHIQNEVSLSDLLERIGIDDIDNFHALERCAHPVIAAWYHYQDIPTDGATIERIRLYKHAAYHLGNCAFADPCGNAGMVEIVFLPQLIKKYAQDDYRLTFVSAAWARIHNLLVQYQIDQKNQEVD